MKNIFPILLIVLAFGCKPDEFESLGERADRVSQLSGDWTISKVVQKDNDAVRKGFPAFAQEQDITSYFNLTDLQLSLQNDNSFVIETGTAPNILSSLTTGTWSVDNDEFPSRLILTSGAVNDTIAIGSFAEIANGKLSLAKVRSQLKGETLSAVVSYDYQLVKQN